MKIYTKSGDKGETSLFGGERVKKNHLSIQAYGTIDELNSWIGLIKDNMDKKEINLLILVQEQLFTIGSYLATGNNKKMMIHLPPLSSDATIELENAIDKIQNLLPEMKNFILPGGSILSSYCHIARCVCRRAERLTIETAEIQEVSPVIVEFLNRLSDFLFVLSRKVLFDAKIPEQPWLPNKK
jgi:cob(I)alamin adenosyltransferase